MRNIIQRLFIPILTCVFLSGCLDNLSSKTITMQLAASPEATASPFSVNPQILPTEPVRSATLTQSMSPTLTLTPEPTSVPELRFGVDYEPVSDIPGREGTWSPEADTLIVVDGAQGMIGIDSGYLYTAGAPVFQPVTVTQIANLNSLLWTPGGSSFVFHGSFIAGEWDRIWWVDLLGQEPAIISEQVYESGITFGDWLDPDHLILSEYAGGGNIQIKAVDIRTGQASPWGAFVHGYFDAAQYGYIPAISDSAGYNQPSAVIISERFPASQARFRAEGNLIILPEFNGIPQAEAASFFEQWLPGKGNQLLVSWSLFHVSPETPQLSHLLVWDIDSSSLRLLAPHARSGMISADGAWLAYLTDGPAVLDQYSRPVVSEKNGDQSLPDYLQLMMQDDQKVQLSIPVLTTADWLWENIVPLRANLEAAFSPDGRYLAFYTPWPLLTGPDGWPVSEEESAQQGAYLNVLNLSNRTLVWNDRFVSASSLFWSPDSRHLLFQDGARNWQLFDSEEFRVVPITVSGGEFLRNPQLSPSGRYLSLEACQPLPASCERHIMIFDLQPDG